MERSTSSRGARATAASRPSTDTPVAAWPVPEGCGQVYVDKVHERDLATPETAHLFGSAEPRLCTPPLRELTPETSLGFDVIDFAEEVLGIVLLPWQRAACIRLLELRPDGSLRFRTVVVLVARQNGKSTLAQVLTIWLLFVWGWPLVLGTAQDLDVAETLWQEVIDIVSEDEELRAEIENTVKVNGKKALVLKTGAMYKVKAANRRAGRGLSGNLILLDELREHQNFDAWGAITKTTMARAEALILALSNAGDVTSRVLRYLRKLAHGAIGDPDGIVAAEQGEPDGPTQFDLDAMVDVEPELVVTEVEELDEFDDVVMALDVADLEQDEETLCLLEWSAPPGCKKDDRAAWSLANPARRYTISDRTLASNCKTDPEWVFRTEVLCQWNDGASNGPFAPGAWELTTIATVERDGKKVIAHPTVDCIVGPVVAGVAQSIGRGRTAIAFAGLRPDGLPQVEIVTSAPGVEWVHDWLMSPDRKGRVAAVAGQSRGAPESTLMKKLAASTTFRLPIVELAGSDLLDAYADADDAIREQRVWHPPWPELDLAAATAEWKSLAGGTKVLDPVLSTAADITMLRAFVAALWLLNHRPPPPPPPPAAAAVIDLTDPGGGFSGGGDFMTVKF